MATIKLDIQVNENNIDIAVEKEKEIELEFGFDNVYTGSYELEPSVDGYTIETANKRMLKDLTVKDIKVSRVENAQGGNTITIA